MLKKLLIITILINAFTVSVFSGCGSSDYETYTVDEEIAHFSFEYSPYFSEIERTNGSEGMPIVQVSMPSKEVLSTNLNPPFYSESSAGTIYIPATITILCYDASQRNATASGDMEYFLTTWTNSKHRITKSFDPSFDDSINIIERSTLVVDGINGEYAFFSQNHWLLSKTEDGSKAYYFTRSVFFDYGGMVWQITAEYDSNLDKSVSADFDHMLKTFKMLD
jgi:hypothetical protein